jgi:hypothetical protein
MSTTRKTKLAVGAFTTAVLGATMAVGLAGSPAGSDPVQFKSTNLVGVGSDTTQEILNAFAGNSAGVDYPALRTTDGSQVLSFDATENLQLDTCIRTRTGVGSIYRPNGSTEGRRALSRAFGGGSYGIAGCGIKSITGLVDFARSSSGPGTTTTPADLYYIPFARDGVSFAYYNVTGAPTSNLSSANLTSLFSTGPQVIGGKLIVPCGIQAGSGTFNFWNTALGINTTQETAGTTFCNGLLGVPQPNGRLQENKTDELKAKGDILQSRTDPVCDGVPGGTAVSCAGGQVISGFSASAYIAAGNNVSGVPFEPTVLMGSINALGVPVSGTAPNLAASAAF